jgi:hypothetical protein
MLVKLAVFIEMSRILFEHSIGALEKDTGQQQQLQRVKITDRLCAKDIYNGAVPNPFHKKSR